MSAPVLLLLLSTLAAAPAAKAPAAKAPAPTAAGPESLLAPLTTAPPASKAPDKGTSKAGADVAGEVRTIALAEGQAQKVHRVRTAPGLPAIIEFPDDFQGSPSCGDCADANASPQQALTQSPALFVIQVFSSERYLAIKPLRYAQEDRGDGPPMEEFNTTVTVRLTSKLTVTLWVEYAKRAQADARVVFTVPGRSAEGEYVKAQVEKARAELEADYARRIFESTTRVLLSALLDTPKCQSVDRHVLERGLRVDVLQLCRMGNYVFVRFVVENRGRTPLSLADATALKLVDKQPMPLEGVQFLFGRAELEFQQKTGGVVGFTLTEGEAAAQSYQLRVTESSGDGREALSRAFGF